MSHTRQNLLEQIAYQSWLDRGCPIGSPEVDWQYACEIVGTRLQSSAADGTDTVEADNVESQRSTKSAFDELGSDEDTPTDAVSVSPFAAAAESEEPARQRTARSRQNSASKNSAKSRQ